MNSIHWLEQNSAPDSFPELDLALSEPDGLLAAGGDLSIPRLLAAYERGIFPWYSDDQPILWWSPDPRMVLFPDEVHIPKRLKSFLKNNHYKIQFDTAFREVVMACAQPRHLEDGTWITEEMIDAYCELHARGHAHSLEIWSHEGGEEKLVGGIYGVSIGAMFFGESMFSRETNASKLAFIALARHLQHWGYALLDAQVESAHLLTLGCKTISRDEFSVILGSACQHKMAHAWELNPEISLI
jgi:leucyl/phenylalanyl-tRNA--protein transferase